MPTTTLLLGDCLSVMATMEPNSVDSIVTDPPAGIAFMNKSWDKDKGGRRQWIAWMTDIAAECLRLIKPGGHALVWALPRTSHWTATAWEDAGFELRDCVYHIFGSGFPKSLDVSKAIDKMAGAEREVIGVSDAVRPNARNHTVVARGAFNGDPTITAPATDAAKQWLGWGSALKPSVECWWLLRKPLSEPTIAANVLAHGTGAINIDACRVGTSSDDLAAMDRHKNPTRTGWVSHSPDVAYEPNTQGRWPANLVLDSDAAALLDQMSGVSRSSGGQKSLGAFRNGDVYGKGKDIREPGDPGYGDVGGASRYFLRVAHDPDEPLRFLYCAKASKRDRDEGLEGMEERVGVKQFNEGMEGKLRSDGTVIKEAATFRNFHPTVKPTALMRWLVRLVTPPGGTVLDPFAGSGSTLKAAKLEGFNGVGIEIDAEYLAIAEKRIEAAQPEPKAQPTLFEVS